MSGSWPLPAPSVPGQHPVETLTVESAALGVLGAAINLDMAQRLADIKVICETYLNDDEAREDIARRVAGLPALHSLMVGDPRPEPEVECGCTKTLFGQATCTRCGHPYTAHVAGPCSVVDRD